MSSLLLWALIVWACFGVGAAALRRLGAHPDTAAEEAPFAIAIGLGLLSYLVLAAGLLGQLKVSVGVGLVAVLALLGWRHMLRLAREAILAIRIVTLRWSTLPVLLLLAGVFTLTLIGALAPAGDNDYDGLFYHLTIPKLYLHYGEIRPIAWLSHANFPFLMEMLYLLGLLLKGQVAAKLFHFGYGWLGVLAVFAVGRRAWGSRAGLLAAAVFASIPFVGWEMMSAYNELAFALYSLLAVFALSLWYAKRAIGWLWVAAMMCGFALGTKMLALGVLLFALLSLLYALPREPERGRAFWRVAAFALIAFAVAAPWYLKSYLWTGSPVYPFFYEVFGGRYWTMERAREYTAAQHAFGLGGGLLSFLSLPWNLTMHSPWFFDQPGTLRPFSLQIAVLGPLFLAFLPTLILTGPVGRLGRLTLWFALCYSALWFAMSQNSRYLIPILPGLCACVGLAASRLLDHRGPTTVATLTVLALALLTGLAADVQLARPATRVALGLESPQEYLGRTSFAYQFAQVVNAATPPEARVLVLGGEPRMFYLDRDFMLGDHAHILSARDLANSDSFLAALRRMGVTHLLLHAATMQNVSARTGATETRLADLVAEQRLLPLDQWGSMSLWELAGGDS